MENAEESKRLFLGVALNQEWRNYISSFIHLNPELKVKWIPEENWHFTVLFMGNVPVNIISELEERLSFIFSQNIQFYLDFDAICKAVLKEVEKLFKEENLPFNMNLHKENIPHVTLSRLKNFRERKFPELILPEKFPAPLHCNEIILFESKLKPSGSEYCKLAAFKLKEFS